MHTSENAAYYLMRFEEEKEAERLAITPLVARIHRELAEGYRLVASDEQGNRRLRVVNE